MVGRKTAKALDSTAAALHRAGKKVGGERGGRAGDALANATLSGLRSRCNTECTRRGCDHH